MALDPVMRAIAENWDSVGGHLTAGQTRRFRALAGKFASPGATPRDRLRATEELADMLSAVLPADHPVRRAIADSGTSRSQLTLEPDLELIEDLQRLLEAGFRRLSGPGAGPGVPGAPSPEEIERDAMARLAAAPALSARALRSRGGDPSQQHLIRLDGLDGPRFPLFQFDAAGQPYRLVLSINALLDADEDPWGVADWWLGRHAWLGRTPAESIGQVADDLLLATARAMVEAGG
jgi:hypothetical protein